MSSNFEPDHPAEPGQQPASRRRLAFFRTLPILVLTLLFGAVIIFLVLRTAGGVRQSEEVVAEFASFRAACSGQAVAEAASYNSESGVHPVVTFRRLQGEWVLDPAVLPSAWFPTTAAGTELVLCLEDREALRAPHCAPTTEGTSPTETYGYLLPLRLVEAQTGELMAEDILSSAPRTLECVEADAEVEASGVSGEQIRNRIRTYVNVP